MFGQLLVKNQSKKKAPAGGAYRERVSVNSKSDPANNSFSIGWVMFSTFFYLAMQVVLSLIINLPVDAIGYRGPQHTLMMAQGIIIAFGFYLGAWIIGVVSPGRRTIEPVLGAVLSVGAAFLVSTMTPQMGGWFRTDGLSAMAPAAVIAGILAAFGAYSGEKLMGNV